MRVHVVDPSAYTPPYDHALCAALAAAGAEVELYTSRFAHGTLAAPAGYALREHFYRTARFARSPRTPDVPLRRPDLSGECAARGTRPARGAA